VIMRLVCACDRNLADLAPDQYNHDFVPSVRALHGVDPGVTTDLPEVSLRLRPRDGIAPLGLKGSLYRHPDDAGRHNPTYRVRCIPPERTHGERQRTRTPYCRGDWQITAERLARAWWAFAAAGRTDVVRVDIRALA
jgi:hypothetical protein